MPVGCKAILFTTFWIVFVDSGQATLTNEQLVSKYGDRCEVEVMGLCSVNADPDLSAFSADCRQMKEDLGCYKDESLFIMRGLDEKLLGMRSCEAVEICDAIPDEGQVALDCAKGILESGEMLVEDLYGILKFLVFPLRSLFFDKSGKGDRSVDACDNIPSCKLAVSKALVNQIPIGMFPQPLIGRISQELTGVPYNPSETPDGSHGSDNFDPNKLFNYYFVSRADKMKIPPGETVKSHVRKAFTKTIAGLDFRYRTLIKQEIESNYMRAQTPMPKTKPQDSPMDDLISYISENYADPRCYRPPEQRKLICFALASLFGVAETSAAKALGLAGRSLARSGVGRASRAAYETAANWKPWRDALKERKVWLDQFEVARSRLTQEAQDILDYAQNKYDPSVTFEDIMRDPVRFSKGIDEKFSGVDRARETLATVTDRLDFRSREAARLRLTGVLNALEESGQIVQVGLDGALLPRNRVATDGADVDKMLREIRGGHTDAFDSQSMGGRIRTTQEVQFCRAWDPANGGGCDDTLDANKDKILRGWMFPCASHKFFRRDGLRRIAAAPGSSKMQCMTRVVVPAGVDFVYGATAPIRGPHGTRPINPDGSLNTTFTDSDLHGGTAQFYYDAKLNGGEYPAAKGVRPIRTAYIGETDLGVEFAQALYVYNAKKSRDHFARMGRIYDDMKRQADANPGSAIAEDFKNLGPEFEKAFKNETERGFPGGTFAAAIATSTNNGGLTEIRTCNEGVPNGPDRRKETEAIKTSI